MIAAPLPSAVAGYESLGLLGRGGSGAVYKALQVSTGQVVALKFPHADPQQDGRAAGQLRHRLHHEMRLCATLHHPHIVRLVDQGLAQDGHPFCVFEYVPGDTLSEHLRRHGALSIAEATSLMARLLDALVWLHARRITHRDLKPQNVMVFSSGASLHPKVLDFGIAACLHDPGARGAGSGTPAYCAPEQLRGQPPAPQADLYAWALLFLECLQGRPVLDGMSPAEARRWQLSAAPVRLPSELERHPLAGVLRKALDKDSTRRSADAAALYRELRGLAPVQRAVRRPRLLGPRPAASTTASPQTGPPRAFLPSIEAVLCIHAQIIAKDGDWDLDTLNAQRSELLQWCRLMMDSQGIPAAGALGDRLIFHLPAGGSPGERVPQAVEAVLDLMQGALRRGRQMALDQGNRLHLAASVLPTEAQPEPEQARRRALNQALHLASLAPHGSVLVPLALRTRLPASLQLQPLEVDGMAVCRVQRA